ncbi:uncharacterized protein LOC128221414 [Mya arenaria]|uniref:uncharacterized protein LOC128221414 n=1 Tax=Mya arenaria TaxID=6604 RepID=UPI0022E12B8B|nr:uncharacterized protein LOC128221414 [Mya arenaria]
MLRKERNMCERRHEKEHRKIETQLRETRWKTPRLTSVLRQENERERVKIERLQNCRVSFSAFAVCLFEYNGYNLEFNHTLDPRKCALNKRNVYNAASTLTCNCSKNTMNVIRALHRLYNRRVERKWEEQNTTVLDILSHESTEKLEEALFMLRGTPTGNFIENILCDKVLVSKQTIETQPPITKNLKKQKALGEPQVSKKGDRKKSDFFSGFLPRISCAMQPDRSSHVNRDSTGTEHRIGGNIASNVLETQQLSVLEKASVTQPVAMIAKWTEIFKPPQMWRQQSRKAGKALATHQSSSVSHVTLRCKRRTSMLKR